MRKYETTSARACGRLVAACSVLAFRGRVAACSVVALPIWNMDVEVVSPPPIGDSPVTPTEIPLSPIGDIPVTPIRITRLSRERQAKSQQLQVQFEVESQIRNEGAEVESLAKKQTASEKASQPRQLAHAALHGPAVPLSPASPALPGPAVALSPAYPANE